MYSLKYRCWLSSEFAWSVLSVDTRQYAATRFGLLSSINIFILLSFVGAFVYSGARFQHTLYAKDLQSPAKQFWACAYILHTADNWSSCFHRATAVPRSCTAFQILCLTALHFRFLRLKWFLFSRRIASTKLMQRLPLIIPILLSPKKHFYNNLIDSLSSMHFLLSALPFSGRVIYFLL